MKKRNRPIKTLKEIEEDAEKDWKVLKYIATVVIAIAAIAIILSIPFMFSSCTQPVKAQQYLREDTTELRAIIRAYNHLLHRVWIDKPNYCEDALMETTEFIELNDLLYSQWEDTFTFYNEQDSIDYNYNWRTGDGRFSDYE